MGDKTVYLDIAGTMLSACARYTNDLKQWGIKMEWQPIETAPKDGTIFDAWCSEHKGYNNAPKRIANCRYSEGVIWFLHSHGWFELNTVDFLHATITHWMPLPTPPKGTIDMADHDHMKAAEPNWMDQADSQMSDLWSTLDEMKDPTALEAWEALDDRLSTLRSQSIQDAADH